MTTSSNLQQTIDARVLHAQVLEAPPGWVAYSVRVSGFAIAEAEAGNLHAALKALIDLIQDGPAAGNLSLWLLTDSLHKDGAVKELARHGREWGPQFGLGIWPDKEPPRSFSENDFLDMHADDSPPQSHAHTVVWIDAAASVVQSAWRTMFRRGSTIVTITSGQPSAMLQKVRRALTEKIRDESFQAFPFYFPILGRETVVGATAEELEGWLGTTQLYIRESEEDKAILLLTRNTPERFREMLQMSGFTVDPPQVHP